MDQQTAQLALQFIQRATLTGNEISAYLQVIKALQECAQPPDKPDKPKAAKPTAK